MKAEFGGNRLPLWNKS